MDFGSKVTENIVVLELLWLLADKAVFADEKLQRQPSQVQLRSTTGGTQPQIYLSSGEMS